MSILDCFALTSQTNCEAIRERNSMKNTESIESKIEKLSTSLSTYLSKDVIEKIKRNQESKEVVLGVLEREFKYVCDRYGSRWYLKDSEPFNNGNV
jgi:hypothetical protein